MAHRIGLLGNRRGISRVFCVRLRMAVEVLALRDWRCAAVFCSGATLQTPYNFDAHVCDTLQFSSQGLLR